MSEAILLSGGIDSAALCCWRRPALAIHVTYGQISAAAEKRAAEEVARELETPFEAVVVDLAGLGLGSMAGRGQSPLGAAPEWWPFRNQMLITIAAMRMAATGHRTVLLGTVATDRLHADNSPAFRQAIDDLLAIQEGRMRLSAPAAGLTSAELVKASGLPREILAWTHSCHVSDLPCGHCRGCIKHQAVLSEVGE